MRLTPLTRKIIDSGIVAIITNVVSEVIGKQIKQLRKTYYPHDDLEAFALRIGVSKNTYQKIEGGKGNPSLNTLLAISSLYDLQEGLLNAFLKPKSENLFELRGKSK
ncbi:MAG: transcriptional regulator with XRE-family HTH domain [Oleispira sp.]|jgi:transcriptional regulator with XRE-family HTH domain